MAFLNFGRWGGFRELGFCKEPFQVGWLSFTVNEGGVLEGVVHVWVSDEYVEVLFYYLENVGIFGVVCGDKGNGVCCVVVPVVSF